MPRYYMNPATGSVDTLEAWEAESHSWDGDKDAQLATLVEVVQDETGAWVEA